MEYRIVNHPSEYLDEFSPLICANYTELELFFPLSLDIKMLRAAEKIGALYGVIARDDEKPVGYCLVVLNRSLINKDILFASNQSFYVLPEYRGIVSGKIMKKAEQVAKKRGSSFFQWGGKPEFVNKLLKHGYRAWETSVVKEL